MRGSHGVCECDILRRANVKADLYLLRGGGSSEPSEPPLGTGMVCVYSGTGDRTTDTCHVTD